jgi:hypothetical protein
MPGNLRQLYDHIAKECEEQNLQTAQQMYAVGWIFYDIFERASHDEKQGMPVKPEDFDRYARDLADTKISRDIDEAQQDLGRVAAYFMEDEIQNRIKRAIDDSVVAVVKANTSGWKPFWTNVIAGVVAGAIFAAITIGGYIFVRLDPSLNAIVKDRLGQQSTGAPTSSPQTPTSSGAPAKN